MKSPIRDFELQTPRDRAGRFEPQLVKKHQTHLTDELERKIIALFGLGNSYRYIRTHIAEIYGMSQSNGTLNAVTDKLIPELQAWRERDLEAIYPIGWLDAIHYKINEHGRYVSKADLHHPGPEHRGQERAAVGPGRRASLAQRAHRPPQSGCEGSPDRLC